MREFKDLRGKHDYRYRGMHGLRVRRLLEELGLGPTRELAKAARPDMSRESLELVVERASEWIRGRGAAVLHNPGAPYDQIQRLLDAHPAIMATALTPNDHIVSEEPLQYPSTTGNVESVSSDPKTALLYAYGIRLDCASDLNAQEIYHRGGPNSRRCLSSSRRVQASGRVLPGRPRRQQRPKEGLSATTRSFWPRLCRASKSCPLKLSTRPTWREALIGSSPT